MSNAEMIRSLELAMHDHYSDYEGLHSCEGVTYDGKCHTLTGKCTCGASEANALIEAVIAELKSRETA